MSLKDHALLVSLSVSKPQMTQTDRKATQDAEAANDAHGAGKYRKDLYPRGLVQPIITVESSARAYIDSTTYRWDRGADLLPTARFMTFAERMSKFEVEFNQAVTAFLNNWTNVMLTAQQSQGALFDQSVYPDVTELRDQFRWRVVYRPVTDMGDFRVSLQETELDTLRSQVEAAARESVEAMLRSPLERLRRVVLRLNEATGKPDREVVDKRGATVVKSPIFRDSLVENIIEEINLLHDFADVLPDDMLALGKNIIDTVPRAQTLRDDPDKRRDIHTQSAGLLAAIDAMLED
jgi:hypothetical protein